MRILVENIESASGYMRWFLFFFLEAQTKTGCYRVINQGSHTIQPGFWVNHLQVSREHAFVASSDDTWMSDSKGPRFN